MQEDFLHYIWKHKKMAAHHLKTTQHAVLEIVSVGQHNYNAGPDFFNAQLKIGGQLWAGNVEIHLKSSDWYVHNHEQDSAYDNVILHVVYEHDTEVFRKDNSVIPTLELEGLIGQDLLSNYQKLFLKQDAWINCEHDFSGVDDFVLQNWLERLYVERLERKCKLIETLLTTSNNDWEAVFFKMLAKNFGLKVNGDAFFSLAQSLDFALLRKTQSKQQTLEALLFGQAGLLEADVQNAYFATLVKDYRFLKQKFQLSNTHVLPVQFFRLRPPNFPTIRLSQLASLYSTYQNLFSKIINSNSLDAFYEVFNVSASPFWKTHYTFEKESKASAKVLTKSFIDLLLINTILPIKFCHAKQKGEDVNEDLLKIAMAIDSEKNVIINAFNNLRNVSKSALQSQALIQLKTEYCDKNKCLQCAVGNTLLIK